MARFDTARRNELAREKGFRNYYQERRAKETYRDDEDVQELWDRFAEQGTVEVEPMAFPKDFAAFYKAFYDPKESKGRDRNSARARFFVEVTGTVASYDVWQERYA